MRYLLFFFLFIPGLLGAQSLLVNGGFEEENICREYKVDCAPEGWLYTVPSFNYYYKEEAGAHSGSHYIGLIAGSSRTANYRSFVRSRLLCSLRPGKRYRLDMYVRSPVPILDSIAVYFSSYDFLFEKGPYHKATPSVYLRNATIKPLRGDTNWQHVVIDYTARGGEAFLSLGNFRKTDLYGASGLRLEKKYFVYFDDVTLLPLDPVEKLCNGWPAARQEIYAEDERHEYQERLMKLYKKAPPPPVRTRVTKILKVDTLVIPDILFATNIADLDKKALLLLDSFMRQRPAELLDSIVVEGHTDNVGSEAWNNQLSVNRANSVAHYLEYFMDTKVIARGWGSTRPTADNRAPGGRRKNRRVEIYVFFRN